jgi:CRP-like cAMP-binding protein
MASNEQSMSASNSSSVPDASVIQQHFSRDDILPLLPNSLWRIEQGAVRIVTWNEEGTVSTLGYWGMQDVVGQPTSWVKPYEIRCLTKVQASLLPRALWMQAIDPIIKQMQQTEELLAILGQNPAAQRVWLLLTFLSQKFGRNVEQGRLIDLRLTHQELAETVNFTRVSVTRTLQYLEAEKKLLRVSRGRLILPY